MRLVLALKIDPPSDTNELALQLMSCLDKLPCKFRSIIAFTPDEGLEATVAHLNKLFGEQRDEERTR
jgi:hypothetical protein